MFCCCTKSCCFAFQTFRLIPTTQTRKCFISSAHCIFFSIFWNSQRKVKNKKTFFFSSRTESLIFRLIYAENYSKWIKGDLSSYAFISFLFFFMFSGQERERERENILNGEGFSFPFEAILRRWISEISVSTFFQVFPWSSCLRRKRTSRGKWLRTHVASLEQIQL